MNPIVTHSFGIVIFVAIACIAPFARKRVRAPWAKIVIVILGLTGVVNNTLGLFHELHWFSLGHPSINLLFLFLDGCILTLFIALAVTGQLFGKKRTDDTRSG